MRRWIDHPASEHTLPHYNTLYALSQHHEEYYKDPIFSHGTTLTAIRSRSSSPISFSSPEIPASSKLFGRGVPPSQTPGTQEFEDIATMVKNGILRLYVSHASDHIAKYEKAKNPSKISRARVEMELLNEIDRGTFPIEWKMAWYDAIISSSNFETFWLSTSHRLKLPERCTARYIPDQSLLEYEAPSSSTSNPSSPPQLSSDRGTSFDDEKEPDEDDSEYISPEAAAFARKLGPDGSRTPSVTSAENLPVTFGTFGNNPRFDPRGLLGDPNGLAREEGDDGGWGHPPKSKKKKKSKTPSPATQQRTPNKTPKAKVFPKYRKTTPAKPRVPKTGGTPKRDFETVDAVASSEDIGAYNAAVMTGSPMKKAKKNSDGTPRQRKPTTKVQAMAVNNTVADEGVYRYI